MKKREKIQLSNKEYDIYEIPLPLSILLNHQKKKHLIYELGKIHPGFTDECQFDSKVSITKKGLAAKVIVINNYVLKNYEQQLKTGRLYSSEFKKKALFHKKNSLFRKIGILSTGLFIFFTILFLSFAQINTENEKEEIIFLTEEKSEINKTEPALNLLKTLLSCINYQGGKINSFEWKINGFIEEFNGNITNMYPDNLTAHGKELNFSALSFSNEIPGFSVNGKSRISLQLKERKESEFPKNEIRELIYSKNGKLISENISPYQIKFEIPIDGKAEKNLLSDLNQLFMKEEMFPEKIRVSRKNFNSVEFDVSFSDYFPEELSPLEILNEFSGCFLWYEKLNENSLNQNELEQSEILEQNSSVLNDLENEEIESDSSFKQLVGKVVHEDGTVTTFYKNKDGKIEISNQ